jgi:hypothetical protein
MAANNFASNITQKLARIFLNKFESERVLSKAVNTQLLEGRFDPSSGTIVNFKRPTDYKSKRTADGDVSGLTPSAIITGKAAGTVQDYFTVDVEFSAVDEAIKMDQLKELIEPMATRIVTDMETDFATFMLHNAGLSIGSPDTAVTTWQHVADAGALMSSLGIPKDGPWNYVINPFTEAKLADAVRSLGAGGTVGGTIKTALDRATLSEDFAGMRVMRASTLSTLTTTAITDRAGTLSAAPNVTYVAAKDTMTQTLAVTAFTASLEVQAGEIIEITGRNMINLSTKKTFVNSAGDQLKFRGVVTAPVTLDGSGAGNLVCAGPGIFESDGAYNTTDTAIASGDVVTLLGTGSTLYQPNLFFHKNAFAIGSVPQSKLFATDTMAQTEDGLQIRVSKGADIRGNKQIVRFDLLPAYSVLNPFFGGQGHA